MKDLQGFTAALNFPGLSGIRLDLTEVACTDRRNFLIFSFRMLVVAPVLLSEAAGGVASGV